jgi:hypothetical protein
VTLAFLSDEWFEAAAERVASVTPERVELDARLQFHADGPDGPVRWAQVILGGRVVEWRPGELAGADLEIHWDLVDAWDQFRGALDGTEAIGAVRVRDHGSGAVGPASPMDLGERPELQQVPRIPGAGVDVQYEYTAGPWGHVSFALSFEDGRVADILLGRLPEPDVIVTCTYRQMAQVRNGQIGVLDVFANGGTLSGREGPMALLAGISESPEFHGAELACGPSGIVLSVLGEVSQHPAFVQEMDGLRALTEPPGALGSG